MSIADIVIIVIVALFALIGLWKGFFKTLISFFGWFISMLIAVLTARVVAEALLDIPAVGNFVAGSGEGFSLFNLFKGILPEGLKSLPAGASQADIESALGGGVVGAILKPFIGLLTSGPIMESSATVSDGIALLLAGGVFEVIVGFGMFVVCRILMTLFTMFAKSLLNSDKKKGFLSRIGGFLFGAVRGALYCVVLLVVISFMTPLEFMGPVTADIDNSVIAKPVASASYNIVGKLTSHENYFNKLLEAAGLKQSAGDTMSEDETAVDDFLNNGFVDNGGLFDKQLIGTERPHFNDIVNELMDQMRQGSANIRGGQFKDRTEDMARLAAELKAAEGETPAGGLYAAFEKLATDLDAYHKCEDADEPDLKSTVEQDLVALKNVIDSTPYASMIGTIEIAGGSESGAETVRNAYGALGFAFA